MVVGMDTDGIGSMVDGDEAGGSVNICLKAVTAAKYQAANGLKLSVPAEAGRKALRKLIHHLLQTSEAAKSEDDNEEQVPAEGKPDFHFLADDEPLRTTLGAFLSRRGRSREETIIVTYYIPLPVPQLADERKPSPNWLSSISLREASECADSTGVASEPVTKALPLVLVGSYSGAVAVYRDGTELVAEDTCLKEDERHGAAIKAVAWASDQEFVTASLDQTVRLWSMQLGSDESGSEGSARAIAEFRSEEAGEPVAFHSVATTVSTKSNVDMGSICIAVGGEDGSVWTLTHLAELSKDGSTAQITDERGTVKLGKRRRAALSTLPATRIGSGTMRAAVTGLQWTREGQLVSGGLDGFVRVWDVEACTLSKTVPCGNKSLLSISLAGDADEDTAIEGKTVVAVGAADGGVRVIDAGGGGMMAACGRKGAHNGVVTSVAWIHADRHIASSGVDGCVRLWDVRAMAMPVRVVSDVHSGQASMAVAVARTLQGHSVYSVGADGRLVTLEIKT